MKVVIVKSRASPFGLEKKFEEYKFEQYVTARFN